MRCVLSVAVYIYKMMPKHRKEENMRTIVCFGDSNTHGYCGETGGRFAPGVRWTGVLQSLLGEEYAVKEEGLGGRTTVFNDPIFEGMSGVEFITVAAMTHEPVDLLIVMLGTNDTKERFGAGPGAIAKGMERLLTKAIDTKMAFADGKPNILCICPPPIARGNEAVFDDGEMGHGVAEKSEKLAKYYEESAKLLGCHFLDAGSIPGMEMNKVDHMHLTEKGHRLLAEAVAQKIAEIFEI